MPEKTEENTNLNEFGWWWSFDEEHYYGPFDTRDQTMADADTTDPYVVCEARKMPFPTEFFDWSRISEMIDEHCSEEGISDPDGDGITVNVKDEDSKALVGQLNKVLDEWCVAQGLPGRVWALTDFRSKETINPEPEEPVKDPG